MDLHSKIMNLPEGDPGLEQTPERAYKLGHRDARHAAAEIALQADAVIRAAEEVLSWRNNAPLTGYLRDNNQSRDALARLAAAVADARTP